MCGLYTPQFGHALRYGVAKPEITTAGRVQDLAITKVDACLRDERT